MNPLSQLTERERRDQRGRSARGRPTLGSALRDEQFREDVGTNALNALAGIPAGVLGMPVDLMTMAMRPFGYSVPQEGVVGSSDWIGRKAGADPRNPAFIAGQFASPDPVDAVKLAGLLDPNALMALGGMTAYHGTPHRFAPEPDAPLGKFRLDKIGTGEGAQAYGHGIYLAESPDVAGQYQTSITRNSDELLNISKRSGLSDDSAEFLRDQFIADFGGMKFDDWLAKVSEAASDPLTSPRVKAAARELSEKSVEAADAVRAMKAPGSLYTVDLPDEQIEKMLDWDKPLSEQPESVRKALVNLPLDVDNPRQLAVADLIDGPNPMFSMRGEDLYDMLSHAVGHKEASSMLNRAGIPGIRYLDGSSRSATPPRVKNVGGRFEVYWGNDPVPVDVFDTAEAAQAAARELDVRTRNFVIFSPEVAKIISVE